jgi:hypothetical protein
MKNEIEIGSSVMLLISLSNNVIIQSIKRVLDHTSFKIMAYYLLFCATKSQVPLSSTVDTKIKESLEKGGTGQNIAFWNWTPKQKSLLDADIPRVIMTSHWSTGKTRILFEKALMLAREGKFVILILHYSENTEDEYSDHAPILLFHSLKNEISSKEDHTQKHINLLVSNDLIKDVLDKDILQSDSNVFIDEFVVNANKDMKIIDDIAAKIDKNSHLWVTVAKASAQYAANFKYWIERKVADGYLEPSLIYPLRNTMEIVEFESALAPKNFLFFSERSELLGGPEKSSEISESSTNQPTIESMPKVTLVQTYDLPTKNWPNNTLMLPQNMCCGQKIHTEDHAVESEPIRDAMIRCFDYLPDKRVLIIVFGGTISIELVNMIEEIRQQGRPLVVDEKNNLNDTSTYAKEYQRSIQKWLTDRTKTQDLIASSGVIAGFEWSSVLLITSQSFESQFHLRNMVMRAMSRLVWLRTNSLEEVQEQTTVISRLAL